jgi:hypothetical protein
VSAYGTYFFAYLGKGDAQELAHVGICIIIHSDKGSCVRFNSEVIPAMTYGTWLLMAKIRKICVKLFCPGDGPQPQRRQEGVGFHGEKN